MNCKYCNEQLEEGVTLCPKCGMENAQMQDLVVGSPVEEVVLQKALPAKKPVKKGGSKKKKSGKKKVLPAICGAVVLGVLVCAILYGFGVLDFLVKENTVTYKNSYTVSDRKALKKGDVVIAVAGDHQLTNSELQIYYSLEVADFMSTYGDYLSSFGLDYTKPLDKQIYSKKDGITWQHMFIGNAINAWYTYSVLSQQATAEGFVIDEQLQQTLDTMPESLEKMAKENGYDSPAEMIQTDFGAACTIEAYLSSLREYSIGMAYFGQLYDTLAPTDAEIVAYFEEHRAALEESGIKKDSGKYVDVRHILLRPEGGTKDGSGNMIYDEAAWEACYAKAQALLEQWAAGEATEGSFGALANQYSQDPGSNTVGGLYTQVAEGTMKTPFNDWIFDPERNIGDYGLVKTDVGYHLMYFVKNEDIWISEVRSTILSERVDAFMDKAKAQYPIVTDYKKIVLGELTLS